MDCTKTQKWTEPIPYPQTNESIPAILAGLDIREGDRILSIGGSGDQAFAMLGAGAERVEIVDCNPAQIRYIQWRMNKLHEGNINYFFDGLACARTAKCGNRYKEKNNAVLKASMGCMNGINGKLVLTEGDIFRRIGQAPEGSLEKIYLSNALPYPSEPGNPSQTHTKLRDVSRSLKSGGLCYMAFVDEEELRDFLSFGTGDMGFDEKRTVAAGVHEERWTVRVYRKK